MLIRYAAQAAQHDQEKGTFLFLTFPLRFDSEEKGTFLFLTFPLRFGSIFRMPRVGRQPVGDVIYHVINRGNGRQRIFRKPEDYDAFVALLPWASQRVPMRILGYCLMPNHWHVVLWPKNDGDLSRFMLRLTTTHVVRYRSHYHQRAAGHLYQGRFKSFPVEADDYFLTLMRYVEANAVRAGLAERARDWRWSSFAQRRRAKDNFLHAWPVDRPGGWEGLLDDPMDAKTLAGIRENQVRGRPFGAPGVVERMAR